MIPLGSKLSRGNPLIVTAPRGHTMPFVATTSQLSSPISDRSGCSPGASSSLLVPSLHIHQRVRDESAAERAFDGWADARAKPPQGNLLNTHG